MKLLCMLFLPKDDEEQLPRASSLLSDCVQFRVSIRKAVDVNSSRFEFRVFSSSSPCQVPFPSGGGEHEMAGAS